MKRIIPDFLNYLKTVFLESGRWVFAIFDGLGILLFFQPHWTEHFLKDELAARIVGGTIFLVSFLLANFSLYRKRLPEVVNDQSLLLYTHKTKTSSAIRMKYVGPERANNVVVTVSYKGKNGQQKYNKVSQFFPSNDEELLFHAEPLESLEIGEVVYFYPITENDISDDKIKVQVGFWGTKSGKQICVERTFPIQKPWWIS
jgi:hypothetical protein